MELTPAKPEIRILIVDDDHDDQFLIESAISEQYAHHRIFKAGNGSEAMEYLTNLPDTELPDLILMDLNMPKLDGRATVQIIRNNGNLKNIPVLILSTSNNPEDIKEVKRLGANDYFVKPASFSGLKEVVHSIIETYGQ